MTDPLAGQTGDTLALQLPGLEPELPLLEWCRSMGLPEIAEPYFSDVTLRHSDPLCTGTQFSSQCCSACVVGGDGQPAGSRWAAVSRKVKTARDVHTLVRHTPEGISDRARAGRLGSAVAAVMRDSTAWPSLEPGDPDDLVHAIEWARETYERVEEDLERRLASGCVFEWLGLTGEPGWLISSLDGGPSWSLAANASHVGLAVRSSCTPVRQYDQFTLMTAPLPALEHTRASTEEVLPVIDVDPDVVELALQLRAQGDGATFAELIEAVLNARS